MKGYTTTTPAFVRTDAGVVHLDEGAPLPGDTLETEYVRLAEAAVIAASPTPTGDTDDNDDAASAPQRGKRRGQSGTTQEG